MLPVRKLVKLDIRTEQNRLKMNHKGHKGREENRDGESLAQLYKGQLLYHIRLNSYHKSSRIRHEVAS